MITFAMSIESLTTTTLWVNGDMLVWDLLYLKKWTQQVGFHIWTSVNQWTTIKTKVLGLKAKSLQYLNDTLSVHLWCQIYWGAILGVLEFVFWFSSWCHLSMSLVWAASPTPGFLDSNSLLYQPPPRNHKFYPIAAGSNHHSSDQIPSQVGHRYVMCILRARMSYGSGHGGAAVLLPGSAISW